MERKTILVLSTTLCERFRQQTMPMIYFQELVWRLHAYLSTAPSADTRIEPELAAQFFQLQNQI